MDYNAVHLFICEGTDEKPHDEVRWNARTRVNLSKDLEIAAHPEDAHCWFCDTLGRTASQQTIIVGS